MVEARLFASKSAPELLEEFRATGAQAPFEEVVRRYAGMVYSVCLRVTKNSHDAEDATQAVFLALAVQGKTAKPIRYIGPWLQQVAHRLSLDIRRSKKRQKAREEKVGEMMRSSHGTNGNGHNGRHGGNGNGNGKHAGPDALLEQDELKRIINDEINQLPSKYRLPLILHYFGGLTREEMAKELSVRPNTLGVRVYRGRELLGKRLAARGLNINAGALSLMLAGSISLRFNESLVLSTCQAVAAATAGVGGGPEVAASIFANEVFGITRAITRGMTLAKIKVVAALAIAIGTTIAGGAEIASRLAPPELRFALPTDIVTRLRDALRSFVRPIQFSSAGGVTSDPAIDAILDMPADHGEPPLHYAGGWHVPDALAERTFDARVINPLNASTAAGERAGTKTVQAGSSVVASSSTSTAQRVETRSVAESSSATAGHAVAGALPPVASKPTSSSGLPQVRSLASVGMPKRAAEVPRPQPQAFNNVVIGAARGARETRVVAAGQSHKYNSLAVGDRGAATFRQTGGSTRIDNDLTVGRSKGSSGQVELSGGTMSTGGNQYVGLAGSGTFTQTGGANVIDGSLFVGFEGLGNYNITRGSLTADKINIAYTGEGHLTQGAKVVLTPDGGDGTPVSYVDVRTGAVTVADRQGSHGTVTFNSGSLNAPNQVIGRAGDGSFVQDGGTNTAYSIWLGSARQSIGSYVLNDGVLMLHPEANAIDGDAGITVGGAGAGSFRMGAANRAAKILETQAGTNLAVRAKASGSGVFQGWGTVGLSGLIVNNGQIIADGYGREHALDLSTAAGVTNTIENPLVPAGTNGWFATNGGQLLLPSLHIAQGSHAYSWGEDPNDALPDLVNSVRLYVRDAAGPGEIDISLLSLGRSDIPALPDGHTFIGVWSFDAHDLDFSGVDLAVRYDDAAAQEKGLSEAVLKLWKYEHGAWVRINDDSFRRYAALNIVSGYTGADLEYFAVSAPEPTCIGAIALGGYLLLRRRRR